jgi:hypothetical protein
MELSDMALPAAAGAGAAAGVVARRAGTLHNNSMRTSAGSTVGKQEPAATAEAGATEREDSNAVHRCPGVDDWFAFDNKVLNTADGGRTIACYAMHAVILFEAICCLGVVYEDVHIKLFSEGNARDILLAAAMIILVFVLAQLVLLVEQMRNAVLRGGALDALGAGEAMISERARKYLTRLRWKLRIAKFFAVFMFLFGLMGVYYLGKEAPFVGLAAGGCSLLSMSAGLVLLDFGLALQVAAVLSSDAVTEVVAAVETSSPTDIDQWEIQVVQPTLALHESHVHMLSRGFAPGLALFYTASWSIALASFIFTMVINFSRVIMLPCCVLFLYLPMAMSNGVAQVSTSCDGA